MALSVIDDNGGAQSTGGTSGNQINGISSQNENAGQYLQAAEEEFGASSGAASGDE